jgi:hypothetical protein
MRMELRPRALDKLYKRRDRIEIPDWQRGAVWPLKKKQKLLDTILKEWHVPVLYFRKVGDETFECVDGQQRLTTIWEFFDNKIPLSEESQKSYGGPLYKDLKPAISDKFDDFVLQAEEIEDANDDEVKELFQRLQLGTALNTPEKLNAIESGLRDFLRELTQHAFLKEKVAAQDTRYAHFDTCSKVAFLVLNGIQPRMRFAELEKMFKENTSFSSGSTLAKKLKLLFDSMNRMFPNKSSTLRNRASIVSFCYLAAQVQDSGQLRKMEKRSGEFFEKFSHDLRSEVEKGKLATDSALIAYQQAISYGTADRESIEKRNEILVNKLILFDPSYAQFFLKTGPTEKSIEKQIQALATDVGGLVYKCNEVFRSKNGEDVFKATNETARGLRHIESPLKEQESYGQFIDALYKIIYEGSGSGKRLGSPLPNMVRDIVALRTDLRHDVDHGKQSKIRAKEKQLTKIVMKYSGKSSIQLLGKEDFLALQLGILDGLKNYLAAFMAMI